MTQPDSAPCSDIDWKDARELPVNARAALIDSLLDSLDSEVDPDAEQLWEAEILRRAQEIDQGLVMLVPWSWLRVQPARGRAAPR